MADCNGSPAILVVGLGNLLLGDDGVGVHAVRAFQRRCPDGVLAAEVGTAILRAEHLLEEADYILAFDAMRAGGPAGSVYVASLDNVADEAPGADSLHDLTLVSVMRHLRRHPKESVVVAAEPESIGISMDLTPALKKSVERMTEAALDIVGAWQRGGSSSDIVEVARGGKPHVSGCSR